MTQICALTQLLVMLSTVPKKNVFTNIISAFLIFLFLYTAINKLINPEHLRLTLLNIPFLHHYVNQILWLVPGAEIITCIFLFVPVSRKFGFLLSSILMAAFSLYVGYMILFIPQLPCSCGGVIQEMTWGQHLVFNVGVLLLTLISWRIEKKQNKIFIAINRTSRTPV